MMQMESIHKYWMPSCRVVFTACWKVAGKDEKGISFLWASKFRLKVQKCLPWPQGCDRATYCIASGGLVSQRRTTGAAKVPLKLRSLVGKGSAFEDRHSL